MSKKCTPLWHEARFQAKMLKAPHVRTTLGRSDVISRALAGMGHLKRICKDAFSVAGAVQETCASEMLGGPGGGFLRGVAFWSIRSSVLGRWFCVTSAAFRRHNTLEIFTDMDWKSRTTHWHEAFSKIEEVSQNFFVFDLINFKSWGSLAELFRFQTCRKTGRQTDRQLQLQLQLQLQPHYTTTTNTKTNILRYSTLIPLHYTSCTPLH